jgi:hypothetical protein
MRTLRIALLCALLVWGAVAADTSWQNLAAIKPGQKIDVRSAGGGFHGEFVRFDAQGITIRDKKGERSVAQAEVSRVSIAKGSRGIWIGAIAGAAGGLAAGAALGSRLANESGGDFNNLKGAVTGGCAAAGALIGTAIGAAVRRGAVVYQR